MDRSGEELVMNAVSFAAARHGAQQRKGTDIPYITHPLGVALLLARLGCNDEILAAAILHDTIEDTPTTAEELRAEFGERVSALVEGASEPDHHGPWEERKRHTLETIGAAPYDVKLVVAADKLHNLSGIVADHAAIGEEVWSRFSRGREQQEWYYRGLAAALRDGERGDELDLLVTALEREVALLFGD